MVIVSEAPAICPLLPSMSHPCHFRRCQTFSHPISWRQCRLLALWLSPRISRSAWWNTFRSLMQFIWLTIPVSEVDAAPKNTESVLHLNLFMLQVRQTVIWCRVRYWFTANCKPHVFEKMQGLVVWPCSVHWWSDSSDVDILWLGNAIFIDRKVCTAYEKQFSALKLCLKYSLPANGSPVRAVDR